MASDPQHPLYRALCSIISAETSLQQQQWLIGQYPCKKLRTMHILWLIISHKKGNMSIISLLQNCAFEKHYSGPGTFITLCFHLLLSTTKYVSVSTFILTQTPVYALLYLGDCWNISVSTDVGWHSFRPVQYLMSSVANSASWYRQYNYWLCKRCALGEKNYKVWHTVD